MGYIRILYKTRKAIAPAKASQEASAAVFEILSRIPKLKK